LRLIAQALAAGRDAVVDDTNPSPEEWQPVIETARQVGAGVVAYWFVPDLAGSLGRNAEDQHPVGDLGPGGEHEPFRISVRARAAWRDLHDLDADTGQDPVK